MSYKNFMPKQIMFISGHKSLVSLAIYQKEANNEKMLMLMSLTYSLMHPEEVMQMNSTPQLTTLAVTPGTIQQISTPAPFWHYLHHLQQPYLLQIQVFWSVNLFKMSQQMYFQHQFLRSTTPLSYLLLKHNPRPVITILTLLNF